MTDSLAALSFPNRCTPRCAAPLNGPRPQARRVPVSVLALGTVVALIAPGVLSACAGRGIERIDGRLDDLLRDSSGQINQGQSAPSVTPQGNRSGRAGAVEAAPEYGTPKTINPEPTALRFVPADEARDVQERLTRYAAVSLGDEADRVPLSLQESLRLSHRSAREFLSAEEAYLLDAIDLLIERRLWNPRFFAETTASVSGDADEGSFQHAVDVVQQLRVTQRLPYGGDVEARLVFNAAEQLREQAGSRYTSSSSLVLDADIPLLRGAGQVAREGLIQSERNLIYAARRFERFRRELLVNIANDYFGLLQSQTRVENQQRQIERLEQLELETSERVSAGRTRPFERNIVANRLLTARSALSNANEGLILDLERFKLRLGLPVTLPVTLDPNLLDLPEPDSTLEDAVRLALEYRLDLQNERDRIADSARAVENARNGLLPDLNVFASLTVPTDADVRDPGLSLDADESSYRAGMQLGLPLDRDIDRLQMRRATIGLDRRRRDYEAFRDNVIIEVRQGLRNVELARFQLELAQRAVEINVLRLQELELRADETDAQTRVDAEEALLEAENNRDQAIADLRSAILAYLLRSGQLRVSRDGGFAPLPGMAEFGQQGTSPTTGDAMPSPVNDPVN